MSDFAVGQRVKYIGKEPDMQRLDYCVVETVNYDMAGTQITIKVTASMRVYPVVDFVNWVHPNAGKVAVPEGLQYWLDQEGDDIITANRQLYSENVGPKCECGVDAIDSGMHSSWCPKGGNNEA